MGSARTVLPSGLFLCACQDKIHKICGSIDLDVGRQVFFKFGHTKEKGGFLYIRRLRSGQSVRYILRESYSDQGFWKHRDILDLGEDPGAYIEYPGGNGYYYREDLEDALRKEGVAYSSDDLDTVFRPFLEASVRRVMDRFFRGAGGASKTWRSVPPDELNRFQSDLHSFDKRRLHYLRCGRVDIGELDGRSWKFLNVLFGKSRDEIEHTIEEMERILKPHEIRPYLYTALHLQRAFPGHVLQNNPVGLEPEKVDISFLSELCRLNEDSRFLNGLEDQQPDGLHPYLVKYVILYFDSDFHPNFPEGDFWNAFTGGRRFRAAVGPLPSLSLEEACRALGITPESFDEMDRKALVQCYRENAKKAHPDHGGDHEAFLRITEAYERLLVRKGG